MLACEFGSQHASARKKLHAQKFSFRNFARCTTRRPRSHCTTTANSKHHSRLLVVTDARCSWKQQQSFATHWHSGCLWSVCPTFAVRERRAPTPQPSRVLWDYQDEAMSTASQIFPPTALIAPPLL